MGDIKNSLNHLAIIMDGNARWAKENKLLVVEGYKAGVATIKKLIPSFMEHKIPYVTLYAFSSENWQRPAYEVAFIMDLLNAYLRAETDALYEANVKLKVIGRINRLSSNVRKLIDKAVERTSSNNGLTLCLAFDYGGRYEIIDACKKIQESDIVVSSVQEFKKYLYDPEMPDVDLLIRTGNVLRVSNFLLWQSAYAELFFEKKYWPEFGEGDLVSAVQDYESRKRTFGR